MTESPKDSRAAEASETGIRTHVGVIDIGSNAIRLQVVRLFEDGRHCVVLDDRDTVRLGSEVFRTGAVSDEAAAAVVKIAARFARAARNRGAESIRAVATSAMREAKNSADILRAIEEAAGISVEIISGEREAAIIARGVLTGYSGLPGQLVLADIGGGSTEVSVIGSGRILFGVSLPLGSSRLTEMFCRTDPLSAEDESALRQFIRAEIARSIPASLAPVRTLIGSAGTFGAVGNFIRRRVSASTGQAAREKSLQGAPRFTLQELSRACACLTHMSLEQRRKTRGIEERRAEIIVAGTILLQELAAYFSVERFRGARRGLRDGLMLEELERLGVRLPPFLTPPQKPSSGRGHGRQRRRTKR